MGLHALLDRVFGPSEEINGHGRCSTYLFRWHLITTRRAKVYLHKFVGDDWSLDHHDHPKRFISLGLWGSYLEHSEGEERRYSAPWARSFPATHRHRITTPWGTCWTLVIVLRTVREWGFWHEGRFIPWAEYVDGAESQLADKMKDCA